MSKSHPAVTLACLLSLVVVSGGCSFGSSADASLGKADADTSIDVNGAIGGIHTGDTRVAVEKRLGAGKTISIVSRHQVGGGAITRVDYPASQLVVMYLESSTQPAWVFGVSTASRRYRTTDGLGVGSTLRQARREPGIRCSVAPGYLACQGGLGYQKPISSFTVRNGRVAGVFTAAVAD
jgi:hypothetical protein